MARNTSKRKPAAWRGGGEPISLPIPNASAVAGVDSLAPRYRVLHLLAPSAIGGIERVVGQLAQGMSARGHRIEVAALLDSLSTPHPFLEHLAAIDVPTHRIAVPGRSYLRERRLVGSLVRRLRPDVVHTHGYRPEVVDAGVIRGLGVPVVSTVHGFTGGDLRNRIYEYIHIRSLRRHDAVVAVSAPLGETMLEAGLHAAKLHVVPNACVGPGDIASRVRARRALGIDVSSPVVGWVGRLAREKGPDLAIRALAAIPDLGVRLVFVGDGPMRQELSEIAGDLGLRDHVHFVGRVDHASRYLRAFDMLLLSSRTEGTPIVLLEGMAAGVPVVATAVGGIPDVISAAEGLLVLPESPQGIAAAIRDTLERPDAAAARAAAAKALLESDFNPQAWLGRYEVIYGAVVSDADR